MVRSRDTWSAYDLAAYGVCCISSAGNKLFLHANLLGVDENWSPTFPSDLEAVNAFRHAIVGLQLPSL